MAAFLVTNLPMDKVILKSRIPGGKKSFTIIINNVYLVLVIPWLTAHLLNKKSNVPNSTS